VRYDSPAFMGFIYSASISDDGSNWGTMLRYANEFNGFRVAAGIGYEHYGQVTAQPNCFAVTGVTTCANPPGYGPANQFNPAPNVDGWGIGLSGLHVPTGLFLQGHYIHVDFDEDDPTTPGPSNSWWGQNASGRIPAEQFLIQGGISKNWFGWGNTAVFGEWSISRGWGAEGGPLQPLGRTFSNAINPGSTTVAGVTGSEVTMYGFGITQIVDAAATEIFLDARHFSADVTCLATPGSNCSAQGAVGTNTHERLQTEDFWAVIGGARVKF
jgi:hypothetical protein